MGKASRRKKDRKNSLRDSFYSKGVTDKSRSNLDGVGGAISYYKGRVLYRSFDSEEYADAFCAGNIRLSTLETCRKYEDPLQGDPEEGIHRYDSGYITGGSDDPNVARAMHHMGFVTGAKFANSTFDNVNVVTRVADAYLVCTSEVYDKTLNKTFGNYWVEILDPQEFFSLVSEALCAQSEYEIGPIAWGGIMYRERSHSGFESDPGPLGFVKPKKYEHQKEVRFMWYIKKNSPIVPLDLHIPGLNKICRRIE